MMTMTIFVLSVCASMLLYFFR